MSRASMNPITEKTNAEADRDELGYELPAWFLTNNVYLHGDIVTEVVEVSSQEELSTVKQERTAHGKGNDDDDNDDERTTKKRFVSKGISHDGCSSGTFDIPAESWEELQDMATNIMLSTNAGNAKRLLSSVILHADVPGKFDPWNKVLTHLAKGMGADFVNLDIEDIEDLAWHFDHQLGGSEWQEACLPQLVVDSSGESADPFTDPRTTKSKRLSDIYFRPEAVAMEDTNVGSRSQNQVPRHVLAIRAVLQAPRQKREQINLKTGNHPLGDSTGHTRPVFVHVRGGGSFLPDLRDREILRSFGDLVTTWCSKPPHPVLLVSDVTNASGGKHSSTCTCFSCVHKTGLSKLPWLLLASNVLNIRIFVDETPTGDAWIVDLGRPFRWSAETRWLKRMLFYRLPKGIDRQLALPCSSWQVDQVVDENGEFMQHFSFDGVKWDAAQQITGRALAKRRLSIEDITTVLKRIRCNWSAKVEADNEKPTRYFRDCCFVSEYGETDTDIETQIDTNDVAHNSERKQLIQRIRHDELIQRLRNGCSEHEEELLSCVVKPADIQSAYDEVIVDESTANVIRQTVSLSRLRAEGNSQKLLQTITLNGVLLYGPPGTGKTHLTRAIAKEAQTNMIVIQPSKVKSIFVGETPQYIAAAFSLAKKLYPCIVFIDEADALFFTRSNSDTNSHHSNDIAQILREVDAWVADERSPLVVAATNRPLDIDDAFMRRLPQKIYFGLPSFESRVQILKSFLHPEDINPLVSPEGLAELTEGFSGSDLKTLCGRAALAWAVEQRSTDQTTAKLKLTVEHFAAALQQVRPTVTRDSMIPIEAFRQRHDASVKQPESEQQSVASDV